MTTKRKALYQTELVDDNKEIDYLNTHINEMSFEKFSYFTIPQYMVNRPDLISYRHYQTVDLWWMIMTVNDITDPFEQLCMGRILKIPSLTEYYRFFNKYSLVDTIDEKFDVRVLL